MNPLVTVICVCYNHSRFVIEALNSVRNQTYANVELIVVDDGSNDGSSNKINEWITVNPTVKFIDLKINQSYCKAFNQAFAHAKGDFIIDLAADDVLLPNRIKVGIEAFNKNGSSFGVQFSDAEYIDDKGDHLRNHSNKFSHTKVPQGNVYAAVISTYFICSPTVMVRRSILDQMGGYDESLAYEDFDLWVRAARVSNFFYIPEVLVKKRVVSGSMGSRQYSQEKLQLESTYKVCLKIFQMNKTEHEKKALNKRIRYELKWNLRFFNLHLSFKYLRLLLNNQ